MDRMARESHIKEMPGESLGMDWKHTVNPHVGHLLKRLAANVPLNPEDQALLQQIELCKQDGPSKHDMSLLRDWLIKDEGNDGALNGPGCCAWSISEDQGFHSRNDFVVLSSTHKNRDRFERWTGDTVLGVYHRFVARHFRVSIPR